MDRLLAVASCPNKSTRSTSDLRSFYSAGPGGRPTSPPLRPSGPRLGV